jgi:ferredoxin-NADP reductase
MRTPPHVEHELELVLEKKEAVADDVVRLVLRHPDGYELPAWAPGAHVDLVLAEGLVRQYSLCGDPDDLSTLHVAVLREEAGRGGSQHVHDELAEGDVVHVRGPRNHFPLVQADRYLFIAGGIGITPILPMIAQVEASGADWQLVYGGRTRSSMAFQAELQDRYAGKVVIHPQDEAGLLDLPNLLADPGATAVYCCGPEGLLAAVEERCTSLPKGTLHVERFAPKEGATDGPRESFEVELAQTGTILTVPADRSVLDVVEDSGVQVLSSCQEGTCGTCETTVLSGIPDHRDSVLTDDEQAANDTMMICVSRSCSARLVLDL